MATFKKYSYEAIIVDSPENAKEVELKEGTTVLVEHKWDSFKIGKDTIKAGSKQFYGTVGAGKSFELKPVFDVIKCANGKSIVVTKNEIAE